MTYSGQVFFNGDPAAQTFIGEDLLEIVAEATDWLIENAHNYMDGVATIAICDESGRMVEHENYNIDEFGNIEPVVIDGRYLPDIRIDFGFENDGKDK